VAQVIGDGPFQIINRRDQPWFQLTTFMHLRGGQSFTPLTATRLGQVLEGAGFPFEPMELFEERGLHRWCKSAVNLGDVLQRTRLVITYQDRVEVPAGWHVASNHEIAPL
jgi:hypothetical protein